MVVLVIVLEHIVSGHLVFVPIEAPVLGPSPSSTFFQMHYPPHLRPTAIHLLLCALLQGIYPYYTCCYIRFLFSVMNFTILPIWHLV